MRILITGAFGNVGKAVIEEASSRGHEIVVFEVDNKKTRRAARKYRNRLQKVFLGIFEILKIEKSVQECDAVIHLAAIIPPLSQKLRELTLDVNFGGIVNLVNAIKETKRKVSLVFVSSASVMGHTQLQEG